MAIANPLPDLWSMILMAIPICGLYFGACWISMRHDKAVARKRTKRDAELDAALTGDDPVASALPASATAHVYRLIRQTCLYLEYNQKRRRYN